MPSNNSKNRRTQRREQAAERQAAFAARSNHERREHMIAQGRTNNEEFTTLCDFLGIARNEHLMGVARQI